MYIRHQVDQAPLLAFERGQVPTLERENKLVPFIPRYEEISDLSKVIEASAVRGKYLVIYGEVFVSVLLY